jgi:hypothetical protein
MASFFRAEPDTLRRKVKKNRGNTKKFTDLSKERG